MNIALFRTIAAKCPKQALFLMQHKTEIITGVGFITGIAGTVLACRSSYKMVNVVSEMKTKFAEIDEARALVVQANEEDKYTETDVKQDTARAYYRMGISTVKLFALPAILLIISGGCFLYGPYLLRKENAAIAAALTGVTESFRAYRERVAKEYGTDKERELYGANSGSIVVDENGEIVDVEQERVSPGDLSPYHRWFDETNPRWERNPEFNLAFLCCQQNWANDKLKAKGFLFLNEVYAMLGFKPSKAGQIVGWVYNYGDGFVDFGFTENPNESARKFINGVGQIDPVTKEMKPVRLDFNVDGVIIDIFNREKFNNRMDDSKA